MGEKEYEKMKEELRKEAEEKEGKKIEDGYFGVLASEKCNELVDEIVKSNAKGYKVFCSIENDYFDNEYTNPDDLENYIKDANDDEFLQ